MSDLRMLFDEAESDPFLDKPAFDAREAELRTALLNAQYAQLADAKQALLIVVGGIDGAGKGATINLINEWMDPRHIRTMAFDTPKSGSSGRAPLWRYWNGLPPKGKTGIVFGSWYADLVREAARKRPRAKRLARLTDSILRFESMLAAEGIHLVKLWFHLSPSAQAARIERLLASASTAWQVRPSDYRVQKKFDRLRQAGCTVIEATHRGHAPWHIVPSADDRLRTIRTADIILQALRTPPPAVAQAPYQPMDIVDRLQAHPSAALAKSEYEEQIGLWQGRLARAWQQRASEGRSLVLVFEGQDASGKGGAIRRVANALDARRYDIHQIAAPSAEERGHPYLWRFWRRLPEPGRIAIFDRSWYGRVLVERVEGFAEPADWQRAYDEICDFESQWVASDTQVLKFWLSVSEDEQLRRFEAREQSPFKQFKITPEDWRNREKWDAYSAAANDMFARTDRPDAPWHVIDADDKRQARLTVLQTIVQALENEH